MNDVCSPASGSNSPAVNNLLWGLAFFLLYLLIYGLLLPRFGLHWDEVLDFDGSATGTYIGAGRWGMALYRVVFGCGAIPWAAGIMAGLFLSTAIVLQTRLLRLNTVGLKCCYGGLMLGMPQFSSMLVYSFQADAVALGFVLSTLACMQLFCKEGRPLCRALAAILLMTLAISIYQTLLFYGCALAVAAWLARWQDGDARPFLRFVLRGAAIVLFAFLLYYALRALTLALPLASEEQLEYVSRYQRGMTQWPQFFSLTLPEQFLFLAHYIKYVIFCGLGLMYAGQWVYTTALLPFLLLLWRFLRAKKPLGDRLFCLLSLAFLWFIPHVMILVLCTLQGERVYLAEPLCCALLWCLYLRKTSLSPPWTKLGALLLGVLLVRSLYTVSSNAWHEALNHERNVDEMRLLCADARRFAAENGVRSSELHIFTVAASPKTTTSSSSGFHGPFGLLLSRTIDEEMTSNRFTPFRNSVESWYDRLYHFSPNGSGLTSLPPGRRQEYKQDIDQLNLWPSPGCMMMKGDSVIVRVSPE